MPGDPDVAPYPPVLPHAACTRRTGRPEPAAQRAPRHHLRQARPAPAGRHLRHPQRPRSQAAAIPDRGTVARTVRMELSRSRTAPVAGRDHRCRLKPQVTRQSTDSPESWRAPAASSPTPGNPRKRAGSRRMGGPCSATPILSRPSGWTAPCTTSRSWNPSPRRRPCPPRGTTMPATDRIVDVRTEIPRIRHQLIFDTFASLEAGTGFVLVNDHDPKPLYYQLAAENAGEFSWDYLEEGPEVWRGRIGRLASA